MADLSDDYLNAIIEHATGYDGDGTQAMNSGDLQSIARAAIAADRALNAAQAAAEPVANPNDPQWMAFVSWAQKRWGSETWRHTSNTCGEWDAWQAGRLAERAAIAAPPQQAAPVAPAGWRGVISEAHSRLADAPPSAFDNSGYREFAGIVLDAVADELAALAAKDKP